jgi:glycosyltransferase involved in cell wall biosynthesis
LLGTADFPNVWRGLSVKMCPPFPKLAGGWSACAEARHGLVVNMKVAGVAQNQVEPSRIVSIPNCVDTSRFWFTGASQPYDLVSVSRLVAVKHVETVVKVTAALRSRFPGISTAILGAGAAQPALRALADELGVGDCVHFLGHRGDVPELLNASRVFLMTSEREGGPMSLLEAMACGIPPKRPLRRCAGPVCSQGQCLGVDDYRTSMASARG